MQRFSTLLTIIAGVAAIGGPALAQGRPQSPNTTEAARTELQSESAALAEDWATVTALSGRSYRESPSLGNEFNLATAYARAGQSALAVPLYEDVVENGEFTTGAALYPHPTSSPLQRAHLNLADEASRRLSLMTGEPVQRASLR